MRFATALAGFILMWTFGGCVANDNRYADTSDAVKAGTAVHAGRAFGFVTEWGVGFGSAKIKLSDQAEWVLAGDAVSVYRPLVEVSKEHRKPILLAVDLRTRSVGMVFSTLLGMPALNGEAPDGKQLLVSVLPSPRVFRLRKDRPWFDEVKSVIAGGAKPGAMGAGRFWVAFDSVTSEIVDVRPAGM